MYLQWDPSSFEHTGLHTSHRPETVKRDGNKWANAAHVVIRGKQESRSNLNYFNRPHLDNRKAECILCWFLCLWIASHCGLPAGSHVVLDVKDSDRSGTAWCFISRGHLQVGQSCFAESCKGVRVCECLQGMSDGDPWLLLFFNPPFSKTVSFHWFTDNPEDCKILGLSK